VTAGGASTSVNLTVTAASPGLFLTKLSDSQLHPVLIRPDGSFVSLSNPARRGETITAIVTGLGATAVAVGTGSVAAPGGPALVTGSVIVGFNTGAVPVVQAERSKDLPGVYLVAFDIPKDAPISNNVNFSIGVVPAGSNSAYYSTLGKIPVSQ